MTVDEVRSSYAEFFAARKWPSVVLESADVRHADTSDLTSSDMRWLAQWFEELYGWHGIERTKVAVVGPDLAVDKGNVFVAWAQACNDNLDVFPHPQGAERWLAVA